MSLSGRDDTLKYLAFFTAFHKVLELPGIIPRITFEVLIDKISFYISKVISLIFWCKRGLQFNLKILRYLFFLLMRFFKVLLQLESLIESLIKGTKGIISSTMFIKMFSKRFQVSCTEFNDISNTQLRCFAMQRCLLY